MQDWNAISSAPKEYQQVIWAVQLCQALQTLLWAIHYVEMVRISFKQKTYAMSLFGLSCNIAWEFVYAVIHPSQDFGDRVTLCIYLTLNLFVVSAAIRFSADEWSHAPLVQRNLPLVFLVSILFFISAHLAIASAVGPKIGVNWCALLCAQILTIGGLCQLLSRGSSRGASHFLLLTRNVGTLIGVPPLLLRYRYWPQAFAYLNNPVLKWHACIIVLADTLYIIILAHIRRREKREKSPVSRAKDS
ncbi:hypothetical protein BJX99DRAFT_263217 [Aspergillus californicus]